MIALIPVIAALLGALVYLLATPAPRAPRFAELGRIVFLGAVLALMFAFAGRTVHLF